jgi:glycosyltransferase involved in cell wall biosynthesis
MHQISIVVTNHNYGHYLARCIRSLLDQTLERKLYEIIVVDDGSTDDSLQVLEVFESEVLSIKLEKNMGLAFAANSGIKKCRSRYICRVDADDYVHPRFLENLLLGFELVGQDFDAISCDYFLVDEEGFNLNYGSQKVSPIACGVAFKSDAFETLGFYNSNLRIHEEVDFMKRFFDAGLRIHNISLPLYRYVQHDGSLTRRLPK